MKAPIIDCKGIGLVNFQKQHNTCIQIIRQQFVHVSQLFRKHIKKTTFSSSIEV